MASDHQEGFEYGPTYKVLFLGACVVIGSLFGWGIADLKYAVTGIQTDVKAIDSRSAELAAGAGQRNLKIERLQHDYDELAARVRELERALMMIKR